MKEWADQRQAWFWVSRLILFCSPEIFHHGSNCWLVQSMSQQGDYRAWPMWRLFSGLYGQEKSLKSFSLAHPVNKIANLIIWVRARKVQANITPKWHLCSIWSFLPTEFRITLTMIYNNNNDYDGDNNNLKIAGTIYWALTMFQYNAKCLTCIIPSILTINARHRFYYYAYFIARENEAKGCLGSKWLNWLQNQQALLE